MGRGGNKSNLETNTDVNAFIKGKQNSVRLDLSKKKKRLGFSPVQATASGAGSHGGNAKTKNKRDRRASKQDLKKYY